MRDSECLIFLVTNMEGLLHELQAGDLVPPRQIRNHRLDGWITLHSVDIRQDWRLPIVRLQALGLFEHRQLFKMPREVRSEEHTSELQSRLHLVCRLLLEKKKKKNKYPLAQKKKNNKKICIT